MNYAEEKKDSKQNIKNQLAAFIFGNAQNYD